MQGYFESSFKGQKKYIDKLLNFILEKSKENQMYEYILELISLPENYKELDLRDEIEIEINMKNNTSGNINFFDEEVYFDEVCKAVPELELKGYYELLNAYNNSYYSPAGISSFIFEGDQEEDYLESGLSCIVCGASIPIENIEKCVDPNSDEYSKFYCSKDCYIQTCEEYDEEIDEEFLEKLPEGEEGNDDEDLILDENKEICELCGRLFTINIEDGIKQYTDEDIFVNHLEGFADDFYDKYNIEYEYIELCETTIPKNESSDENMLCINCYTENNEMYYPLCKSCGKIDLIARIGNKYFNFSNKEVVYESDNNYTCNNCRRD